MRHLAHRELPLGNPTAPSSTVRVQVPTVRDLKPLVQAQHGIPPELQQYYLRPATGPRRRLNDQDSIPADASLELDVELHGGVGAGLSCPCFGCGCRVCEIQ
jgi:hypothetical protein